MTHSSGPVGVYQCNGCTVRGSCPVYCNDGKCQDNAYLCAWPNLYECSGASNCVAQTDVPRANGCCFDVTLTSPCSQTGVICNIVDCGPCDGIYPAASNVYCYNSANNESISCVTSSAYHQLCGCNPILKGFVYCNTSVQQIHGGCGIC